MRVLKRQWINVQKKIKQTKQNEFLLSNCKHQYVNLCYQYHRHRFVLYKSTIVNFNETSQKIPLQGSNHCLTIYKVQV